MCVRWCCRRFSIGGEAANMREEIDLLDPRWQIGDAADGGCGHAADGGCGHAADGGCGHAARRCASEAAEETQRCAAAVESKDRGDTFQVELSPRLRQSASRIIKPQR